MTDKGARRMTAGRALASISYRRLVARRRINKPAPANPAAGTTTGNATIAQGSLSNADTGDHPARRTTDRLLHVQAINSSAIGVRTGRPREAQLARTCANLRTIDLVVDIHAGPSMVKIRK